MGLFNRNKAESAAPPASSEPSRSSEPERPEHPSPTDWMAVAQQKMARAMETQQTPWASMQAQVLQNMQQLSAVQHSAARQQATEATSGRMTWVRQVMAILAPPQAGYVKRCSCAVCGAAKKLPTVTAYVYCDYCASLIDYDLRRASEVDTAPSPAYAASVNAAGAASRAAVTAGDRAAYLDQQRRVWEAYVTHMPQAVSHRAKNDPEYRAGYVEFMAAFAAARAFDPEAKALEAEMTQHILGIRRTGPMMSAIVPETFWPVVDTLEQQIGRSQALYDSAGLVDIDPDHAGHLTGKFAWSGFCQGWLGQLPEEAADRLLDRAGLKNAYVPIEAEDGQPRHCGGCGAEFSALPGATAIICEGCGRKMDLGSAEIPCASCGATMTLPAGADDVACPFCQSRVERAGML